MLSPFVLVCLLQVLSFGLGQPSDCSQLNLSSPYIVSDDSYAIITNNLPSSTVIQVSLTRKKPGQDASWFVMGASDSTELIGSWQPFTSDDGEMVDCSTSSSGEQLEQIVTNKDSRLTTANRTVFTFYWMPSPTFNGTVTFLARILLENTTDRFIQSLPMDLRGAGGRQRLQDVPASEWRRVSSLLHTHLSVAFRFLQFSTVSERWRMCSRSSVFLLSMCSTLEWVDL